MKRWIIVLVTFAILGFVGYKVGMNYISEKLMDQVTEQVLSKEDVGKMLQDPDIKKTIEEQIGEQGLQTIQQQAKDRFSQTPSIATSKTDQSSETGPSVPSESSKLAFSSKEEALSFLLTKFSMDELKGFISKAQGGLTAEEKAEIKSEMLARISPEEFQALKVLGLIEISKRKE